MIRLAKFFEEEELKSKSNIYLHKWEKYYLELKNFIDDSKSLPNNKSNPKLYNWIRKQIAFLRNKKNYQSEKHLREYIDKKNKLNELKELKEYLDNELIFPESRWLIRYNQVKKFVLEKGVLPSDSKESEPEENILARWLTVQIQALRGISSWKVNEEKRGLLLEIPLIEERYKTNRKRKIESEFKT